MEDKFTQVSFDVYCTPEPGQQPRYRVFVSGELFAERTWIWGNDVFLEEIIPISAPPGQYLINCVLLDPDKGTLKVRNMRISQGIGNIIKNKVVDIL